MRGRLLGPSVVLLVLAGCRPPGDGAAACGSLEPRNDDEIVLCNELDQAVIASVALPSGEPPASGWPGIVMLHGSTGLFLDGEDACSETLQDQFRIWGDTLTSRGYAVIMPASFYSRGFCDWTQTKTVPRKYDDVERIVTRTFDTAAAAEWACADERVDCERLAVFGFSNGASTAMLAMQEDLSIADDSRLHQLDGVMSFEGGLAYYPGCGLESQISSSLDASRIDEYFYPQGPMWVPHAEKDKLLERCEELRDPQVDAVADERGVSEDMFEIEVYADAKHGFDVWFTGDPQADLDARTAAQEQTLARLDAWLQ